MADDGTSAVCDWFVIHPWGAETHFEVSCMNDVDYFGKQAAKGTINNVRRGGYAQP